MNGSKTNGRAAQPLFPEFQRWACERDDLPRFLQRDPSPAIVERQARVASVRAALAVMLRQDQGGA
jgi:hypothetical protein